MKNGAVLGLYQLVDFESDEVTLDIPLEGISIKGWKITPLMRPVVSSYVGHIHSNVATNFPHWLQPQVTKKQVDNFKEGKVTPCCQLKAEFELPELEVPGRTRTLKHQVTLQGAKYPYNIFTIDLPPEGTEVTPQLTKPLILTIFPSLLLRSSQLSTCSDIWRLGYCRYKSLTVITANHNNHQHNEYRTGPPPTKRKRLETSILISASSSNQGKSLSL